MGELIFRVYGIVFNRLNYGYQIISYQITV